MVMSHVFMAMSHEVKVICHVPMLITHVILFTNVNEISLQVTMRDLPLKGAKMKKKVLFQKIYKVIPHSMQLGVQHGKAAENHRMTVTVVPDS